MLLLTVMMAIEHGRRARQVTDETDPDVAKFLKPYLKEYSGNI